MNLQPIYPTTPDFTAPCLGCGRTVSSSSGLADLDGEPFKAYYCSAECASAPEPWRTVDEKLRRVAQRRVELRSAPQASEFQVNVFRVGGALLHCGPNIGKATEKTARKLHRRWCHWRRERWGENVPSHAVVVFVNYTTGSAVAIYSV